MQQSIDPFDEAEQIKLSLLSRKPTDAELIAQFGMDIDETIENARILHEATNGE